MVMEIKIEDLDIDIITMSRIKNRGNNLGVDEHLMFQLEPNCPKLDCYDRGNRWECYQGFYEECEVYDL